MPILAGLVIILQIICGIHAIRTNQDHMWLRFLLFPGVGLAIYFLGVLVPSFLNSFTGKRTIETVQNKVAPGRNLKTLRRDLAISDTTKNRIDLADELARLERYDEAIEEYSAARKGIYVDDPKLLIKLASAQFYSGNFQEAKILMQPILDEAALKTDNQEAYLIYTRALECLNETTNAEEAYRKLVQHYTGPEAKFCYARFLLKQERQKDAKVILQELMDYREVASKAYRRRYRDILREADRLYHQLT